MSRTTRTAVAAIALVALLMPTVAAAAVVGPDPADHAATFDTPSPTPPPDGSSGSTGGGDPGNGGNGPRPTQRPGRTPPPTVAPATPLPELAELVALPEPGDPQTDILKVAYRGDSVVAQAPLLLAQLRGYFAEAGLGEVVLARTRDPVRDVRRGTTDIAVVRYRDARGLGGDGTDPTAIAGYQNYAGKDGAFGGDALVARPGLVDNRPATVVAFLTGYVRALQELGDPETVDDALAVIEAGSDLAIGPDLAERWADTVARYGPFDGGFGDVEQGDGLGELTDLLRGRRDRDPGLDTLITAYPLNLAQAALGLPMNPATDIIGGPSLTDITIGLPGGDTATSPINTAAAAGFFTDVGFESVDIVDVERALPGVMTSQLDIAVIELQDAADGIEQGLPIRAIAGHRNYLDGVHGGDVIIASPDLIGQEGATALAFLVAYIRGSQQLAESADGGDFAAYDGGFGDRANGGGLAELRASLRAIGADRSSVRQLVDDRPLTVAQAWWGMPSNPTTAEPEPTAEGARDAEEPS